MTDAIGGLRKSAIVLLSLGEQHATELLRRLDAEAAGAVREEMLRVGSLRGVSLRTRQIVLGQFCNDAALEPMQLDEQTIESAGLESAGFESAEAESVAEDVQGDAVSSLSTPAGPFAAFHDAETDSLFDTIRDEHPQTIALVLAHLPPAKAGELLNRLEPHRKVEVVRRITGIEQTSAEVIEQVERSLRERLRSVMGRTIRSAGVTAVAEILNAAASEVEKEILSDLDAEAPDLAGQIRRVQAIFEDLLEASDADLRTVLDHLDETTTALAIRTAGERLTRKVLRNLPLPQAEQIAREIADGEPVLVCEIEAAHERVAEVVHRLDAAGEIRVLRAASREAGAEIEEKETV